MCTHTHTHTQLHAIISEESCYKMMELYTGFVESIPPSFVRGESRLGAESAYQRKAESLMGDDNCCRVVFVSAVFCGIFVYIHDRIIRASEVNPYLVFNVFVCHGPAR